PTRRRAGRATLKLRWLSRPCRRRWRERIPSSLTTAPVSVASSWALGTADRFRNATYVAVDEPVAEDVKSLAATLGAKFIARSREAFLEQPAPADVVILMNTLHHIPF